MLGVERDPNLRWYRKSPGGVLVPDLLIPKAMQLGIRRPIVYSSGGPSYSLLQSRSFSDGSGTLADNLTYNNPVTAGSLLVLLADAGSFSSITDIASVSDNNSNTHWTRAAISAHDANNQFLAAFYCWNANAGTTTTTLHYSGTSVGNSTRTILEFSGVRSSADPLDKVDVAKTGTLSLTANTVYTNSVTPGFANGLALAFVSNTTITNATTTPTPGTNWALANNNNGVAGTNTSMFVEWQTLGSIAALSGTVTFLNDSGDSYQGGILVFKAP